MKSEVLAAIGESGRHHPAAVNAALAANDRLKYAFRCCRWPPPAPTSLPPA